MRQRLASQTLLLFVVLLSFMSSRERSQDTNGKIEEKLRQSAELRASDLPAAYDAALEALALARKQSWDLGIGRAHAAAAAALIVQGQTETTHEHLDLALSYATMQRDTLTMAAALRGLAIHAYRKNKLTEANQYLDRAIMYSRTIGDLSGEGEALLLGGQEKNFWYKDAKTQFSTAMRQYERVDDRAGMATAMAFISLVSVDISGQQERGQAAERAVTFAVASGDSSAIAIARIAKGADIGQRGKRMEAVEWFRSALHAAVSCGNREMKIQALWSLALNHYNQRKYEKALSYYRQTLAENEKIADLPRHAYIREKMALCLGLLGRRKEAMMEFQRSYEQCCVLKDTVNMTEALWNLAYNQRGLRRYDSARAFYLKALDLTQRSDMTAHECSTLIGLGELERVLGRYPEALMHFLAAAELLDPDTESIHHMNVNYSLGQVCASMNQYDKALEYYREMSRIAAQNAATAYVGTAEKAMGNCYLNQAIAASSDSAFANARYLLALEHYQRMDSLAAVTEDWNGHAVARMNIGVCMMGLGLYNEALPLLRDGLPVFQNFSSRVNETNEARTLGFIAQCLYERGNIPAALDTLNLAVAKSVQYGDREGRWVLYQEMSRQFADHGDYSRALAYHRRFIALRDSLLNEKNLRTINELNAKYEADQREKQIALLEKDREITQLELDRQKEELRVRTLEALKRKQEIGLLEKDREIQSLELLRRDADLARQQAVTERREQEVRLLRKDKDLQASLLERETFRRNATLVGLAALLLVTGLIFWRYREKQRSNRQLERTLGELRRTQDQLIHTEKMAMLGELTAGIAHEIKNPLNFVTNFSTVSTEMVDELEQQVRELADVGEQKKEVLALLQDLKGNMGRIHQHGQRADGIVASMLLHARSQKGVRQEADINTLLREAVQLAWHGMRAQIPDFTVEIMEDYGADIPRIEVIPQEISRVFLNVLSNAFQAVRKHSKHETKKNYVPQVHVHTRMAAASVEIRIRDNGPGIPQDIHEKIFQPFFTTKSTGEGTGLGLSLSYDIVVKGHGGKIHVESEEGEYTAFIMTLPVSVKT